ncbi:MAG TPA: isoleucine--tRNA ligase [Planctomycetota bacterium]|nr:isoleucine--tRNA ligase [Planctomycetota bacterium]
MSTPVAAARFAPLPEGYTSAPDAAERAVLERWQARDALGEVLAARADAPLYVFWEGPPTANGRPGIHHVLARAIKDTVCRFQTMQGRRVERKAGWDTHGLPVELEVEKALGISGKPQIEAFGVAEFNERCRQSVWTYREEWERLSARIGYWLDYEHPYVTYAPEYIDSVWYLLAKLHEQGLVYRGKRVLPYCGRCGTGLSSHELGQPGVYRDVQDPSVTVRFILKTSCVRADRQHGLPEAILAWTTTPWTLPSNFALAVHPKTVYTAWEIPVKEKDREAIGAERQVVWLAESLHREVLREAGITTFRADANAHESPDVYPIDAKLGHQLVGVRYKPLFATLPPFADPGSWDVDESAIHQVVAGDFVTVEDGTGIVHQAPYGADDWETARTNRMPLPEAVGREGRFVCDVGPVKAGTFFKDADKALTRDLQQRGLLFHGTQAIHSYPHCWRCDTPLYYFPAPAWYVRTTDLKARMLEQNARVRWVPPEVGSKRFGEWLENNVDWNISRDRYWGTPLPFWVCDGCERVEALGSLAEVNRRARVLDADGALGGAAPALTDPHKPGIDGVGLACADCGGVLRRTPAVLDCWFDSGAMPYAQHGWPHVAGSRERVRAQFPADFICEGLDQTRGWFYTLHALGAFVSQLAGEGLEGDDPAFRTCLVTGLVLDKDGVKMSKRLGNVIDPWAAVAEHGADAVRWYLIASAAPWLPKRVDLGGVLDTRRRFLATLVNSYQFFREYARLDGFDPRDARIPPLAAWGEIDRWLVSRTASVAALTRARLADHDLTGAARALEGFVVDELSNWYIRRNRRRFWKGAVGADKLAAYSALFGALRTVSLCIAPMAPFLAEILWERLEPEAGSVHAQRWPAHDAASVDPALEAAMDVVVELVVMGRALRERIGQRVRQPLRALHVRSSDAAALRLLEGDFARGQVLDELNVKSLGSLGADDGRLCRLTAKANFKVLGKRLGPRMKAAAAAIADLPSEDLARLRAGASIQVELEGEPLELGAEDVLVSVETTADFEVETDGRFVLWLDTELDEALRHEGLAREAIVRVNALRKSAGLAVEERIRLSLGSPQAQVRAALERHRDLIASETLAVGVEVGDALPADASLARERWDLEGVGALEGALSRA